MVVLEILPSAYMAGFPRAGHKYACLVLMYITILYICTYVYLTVVVMILYVHTQLQATVYKLLQRLLLVF